MGVKGKAGRWGETSLSQLVRNPAYSGRRKNAKGGADLEVEPLVTIDTQEHAKGVMQAFELQSAPSGGARCADIRGAKRGAPSQRRQALTSSSNVQPRSRSPEAHGATTSDARQRSDRD